MTNFNYTPAALGRDIGWLFNEIDDGWLGISSGRKLSNCPRLSGVGDSGVSGMGVICWHN